MTKLLLTACALGLLLSSASAQQWTPEELESGVKKEQFTRHVPSGKKTRLYFFIVANPDCSPVEGYEVKTTLEPKHGKIEFVTSSDYASWSKDNVRFKCNEKKLRGTDWVYQSNDGYRGDDEFEVTIFTPNGTMVERHYNLNVR